VFEAWSDAVVSGRAFGLSEVELTPRQFLHHFPLFLAQQVLLQGLFCQLANSAVLHSLPAVHQVYSEPLITLLCEGVDHAARAGRGLVGLAGEAVHSNVLLVEGGGAQGVEFEGGEGVGDLDLHLVEPVAGDLDGLLGHCLLLRLFPYLHAHQLLRLRRLALQLVAPLVADRRLREELLGNHQLFRLRLVLALTMQGLRLGQASFRNTIFIGNLASFRLAFRATVVFVADLQ
jgi:hypothetical protein